MVPISNTYIYILAPNINASNNANNAKNGNSDEVKMSS